MSTQRTATVTGIDGSAHSDRALAWAADEAARTGRTLRILHVVEVPVLALPGYDSEGADQAGDRILRDGRDLALDRRPGLSVETALVHDRTVPAGLRQHTGDAAEVVIGHRGLGGFAGLLLGSTALRTAGHFPGPVIVVRGPDEPAAGEVVVGLDLVEDPAPALDHAFAAATARKARLRALHVWRPAPLAVPAGVDLVEAAETRRSHQASVLHPWLERFPGVEVVREAAIGHPVDELAKASERAELLVVGSRGRTLPLGSVSHGAIHHAHCPVAVVRPCA